VAVPVNAHLTGTITSQSYLICKEGDRQVLEVQFALDRPLTPNEIDVGHSICVLPQNSEQDVAALIKAFEWDPEEFIGNDSVRHLLTFKIDIRSRKIKDLNKLLEDSFEPSQPYTLVELAMSGEMNGHEFPSYLIADLPKLKERQYSVVSDPFEESVKAGTPQKDWQTSTLRVCFTLHQFKDYEDKT